MTSEGAGSEAGPELSRRSACGLRVRSRDGETEAGRRGCRRRRRSRVHSGPGSRGREGAAGRSPRPSPRCVPPGVQLLNIRGQDAAAVLGMPATCPVAPR